MIERRLFLGLSIAVALTGGDCLAQSVARVLIQDGWNRYQDEQLSSAEELLEEAVTEANAARNESDQHESRAKLAWVKFKLDKLAAATKLARHALAIDTSTSDAGRAELILARTEDSPDRAVEHLRKATEILESSNEEQLVADTHLEMARIHLAQGNYQKASVASGKASSLFGDKAPTGHAQSLIVTARAAVFLNRPDRADRALEEIRALLDGAEGLELSPGDTTEYFCAAADSRFRQGDLGTAYALLYRARAYRTRDEPGNHLAVAPIVIRQAEVMSAQGKLLDALRLADWAAKHSSRLDGHLGARAFATRSRIHLASGRLSLARSDAQMAVRRYREACGATHPSTLQSRLGLAATNLLLGQHSEAEVELREVLENCRRGLCAGNAWSLLARGKLILGNPEAAISIATRALELLDEAGARTSGHTLETLLVRGSALVAVGRLDEAEKEVDRILELRREMTSESDLWAAKTLVLRGHVSLARGQDESARNQFERSLEIWQSGEEVGDKIVLRPEFWHPDKGYAHLGLAVVELAADQVDAAEARWEEAYAVMSIGLPNNVVASRVAAIADFCVRYGRDFDAAWLYVQSRELYRDSLGESHRLTLEVERKLKSLVGEHSFAAKGMGSNGKERVGSRDQGHATSPSRVATTNSGPLSTSRPRYRGRLGILGLRRR